MIALASALHAGSCRADADDVLQMMADATVIDATCRTTNTLYGAVFRYGEVHGIDRDDILISGKRRTAFEAAMARRRATTPPEDICGSLLTRYREAFPDWFRSR